MENDYYEEQQVPSAVLKGVLFSITSGSDAEKLSAFVIGSASEVSDPRLGLPNPSSECSTCAAKDYKRCDGHNGLIKFPCTILHPYYPSEVVKLLNKICPGCKSIRKQRSKVANAASESAATTGCKYCRGSAVFWYPPMKFSISSKDYKKSSIVVEINERVPAKALRKPHKAQLAPDYWEFIPQDAEQDESSAKPNRRVLSHSQVRHLLKGIDQKIIQKFIPNMASLFLSCFPVTPNSHRVTEVMHAFSHGQRLVFDNRTRAYKKLVDFRGTANELGSRVQDCLKISKLNPDKLSSTETAFAQKKKRDPEFVSSGLRWMKDVILGKRSDRCFRMVVVGDPNLKPSEIGIPCYIAERLQISETLNSWNWEKLNVSCNLSLLEKGNIFVRRQGKPMCISDTKELAVGDTINRPLRDGDMVLINRPPSIHQHSLIALSVKVLPVSSVLSINPLCCSPLRGDFDGDCLHGYIPQSVEARVELKELVSLNRQLTNEQSGRNLLSLGQDSLTAAHLVLDDNILLNQIQIQQLNMWCPHELLPAAIVRRPSLNDASWTGKQLFSMLLPPGLDWDYPLNNVCIRHGEIMSSEGSSWLRDADGNLIQHLIKHCPGKVLDFLETAQEVLCEWLSARGFSVSLSDLYLSTDTSSRKNMMEEVFYGLREADETCNFKQLMVEASQDFLAGNEEGDEHSMDFGPNRLCYEKQKCAALSQGSVDAFRRVFRDIQNLAYRYASKDNSMMTMFKAGSKGNLIKIVQHSMCLGLQHSLVPLPFKFPHQLSCASWNSRERLDTIQMFRDSQFPKSFIPYAVVENSFLTGLNPLECFVHSVTNRSSSFSENAEVPGTLHRKLMFFMRDLYISYDGTVRNAYGKQLVEFDYYVDNSRTEAISGENFDSREAMAGQPVGSLCACAISEAAYSALDQPISLLETSPLLNLKSVVECGSKKSNADQTMSLFLSKKLGRIRHGFEYGALEVKDYLERVTFSDIVSTVMIIFSPENCRRKNMSPWVCHFHICREITRRRGLEAMSIIESLQRRCKSARTGPKATIPCLQIESNDCSAQHEKENAESFCITVSILEEIRSAPTPLNAVQNILMPFLLGTVVKGLPEIKKVDILWRERYNMPKWSSNSSGELYLKVSMSAHSDKVKLWSKLMNGCIKIMDAIDWTRSHSDNICEFSSSFGVDAGLAHFLNCLQSAISDTGKTVLREHMLLIGNLLSSSGEFVSLNAKGMGRQRESASVSSPFVQACFSSPGTNFIKAAKAGLADNLEGSLDALAWGRIPAFGTGEIFDLIYSGKGHELAKAENVYNLLSNTMSVKDSVKLDVPNVQSLLSDKSGIRFTLTGDNCKGLKKLQDISKSLRNFLSYDDIYKISKDLRTILYKYEINESLSEYDKALLRMALKFHPNGDQKIGSGTQEIKVGHHPKHKDSRCFILVRTDGTTEDFSYHKCVLGALEIIAPQKVQRYRSRWLKHDLLDA